MRRINTKDSRWLPWPRTMWAAASLTIAMACHKQAPAVENPEAGAWVGKENITVAEQRELQVGPAISGTLAAERSANLRAEVGGAVVEVRAEPGEVVNAGSTLIRIDDTGLRDSYQSAHSAVKTSEMNVDIARRNAERATTLTDAGAISERDKETAVWNQSSAESQLEDARARLVTAEKQLSKTIIRAPFRGVVSERPANLGDVVQSGTALVSVVDPASLKFEGTIPSDALAGIAVGTPVQFTVTGTADLISGKVSRINPTVDPATRQVRLTVAVPNSAGRLLAGLFAEGRVATASRESVVVPNGAVDRRGIKPYVMRVKQGRVEKIEVELGLIDQALEQIEVRSGLAAGDTLLLGGARGLAPGTAVKVGSPSELTGSGDESAAGK